MHLMTATALRVHVVNIEKNFDRVIENENLILIWEY